MLKDNYSLVARLDTGIEEGIATGYMSKAATDTFAATFVEVPASMDVVDVCSDDRLPTQESIAVVDKQTPENTMSLHEGYASIFGGIIGKAVCILASGAGKHGENFIDDVGGLEGVTYKIYAQRGTKSTLHSDTSREGGSAHFDPERTNAEVGCLYNGNLGEVMHILAGSTDDLHPTIPHIRQTALLDLLRVFTHADNHATSHFTGFERILAKEEAGRRFSFDRTRYAQQVSQGTPVVILEGAHPSVLDTGVIYNFHINKVGSPHNAARLGVAPHYRADFGRIALGICPVLQELNIEPERFLEAAVMCATAVRAALVGHDSNPQARTTFDPKLLPIGTIGDPRYAIRQITRHMKEISR